MFDAEKIDTLKKLNKENKLIEACMNGDISIVKEMLNPPVNIDIHVQDDRALIEACFKGHLEVVKYLLTSPDLKEHANIYAQDNLGLKWIFFEQNEHILDYLLFEQNVKISNELKTWLSIKNSSYNNYENILNIIEKRDLHNYLNSRILINKTDYELIKI